MQVCFEVSMRHRHSALDLLTNYGFLAVALLHNFAVVPFGHAVRPESPDGNSNGDLSAFGEELQRLLNKVSNTIASGLNMSYHVASEEDRHYKELRDRLRHGLQGFAHGAHHLESRIPKDQSKWIADIQGVIQNATVHHEANTGNSLGALQSRNALPRTHIISANGKFAETLSLRDPVDEEKVPKAHAISRYTTASKDPIDGAGQLPRLENAHKAKKRWKTVWSKHEEGHVSVGSMAF